MHPNAVEPAPGTSNLGSYDLFVPPKQDNRVEIAVQGLIRDAIIDARVAARELNREELTRVTTVPRVRSVTVTTDGERGTVGGLNFVLPVAFMFLLFMGVMGGGPGHVDDDGRGEVEPRDRGAAVRRVADASSWAASCSATWASACSR